MDTTVQCAAGCGAGIPGGKPGDYCSTCAPRSLQVVELKIPELSKPSTGLSHGFFVPAAMGTRAR